MAQPLHIVMIGHVDHGKSTLLGRLLHDTDSLPEGKQEELKTLSARRGSDIEWSFVLDAFQAERDQNVTIDTTQARFKTQKRDYVMIDAPGHREFLKNMISGAACADAAVLVIDATEGLQEQTCRHAYLVHLLGLRHVIVAVNKMDIAGYNQSVFEKTSQDISAYLQSFGISPAAVIAVAARAGLNVTSPATEMNWYKGPSLLAALDALPDAVTDKQAPLRFSVQDVYKFGAERVIAGRVEAGTLNKGDQIYVSPGGQSATVTAIKVWPDNPDKVQAHCSESIGITLDQRLFVERGHVLSHAQDKPVNTTLFTARVFWLDEQPLQTGMVLKLRQGTQESSVTIAALEKIINISDLKDVKESVMQSGMIADVMWRARDLMALDQGAQIVLYCGDDVVGGGVITSLSQGAGAQKSENITAVDHLVSHATRAQRAGYKGQVFWLTGLSGAGKSTLAMRVEKILFERGYQVCVLDGDNLRHGLCADLAFSADDRRENIRRAGEVAALMADAGMVVISAFISPFSADRQRARDAAGGHFHEIYISADLKICEARDPKGLYAKARAGVIKDFTGIDSPYEAPLAPELKLDTGTQDIDRCVDQIIDYIEQNISLTLPQGKIRAF